MFPDKFVQQQADGTNGNENKTSDFDEVSHLNVDYNMIW